MASEIANAARQIYEVRLTASVSRELHTYTKVTCRAALAIPDEASMSSEVAREQAQAEGLTLRAADNKTGYFGVHLNNPGKPKPYKAEVRRGGKQVSLGNFATAEEAALCVARSPEGQAAAGRVADSQGTNPAMPSGAISTEKGMTPAMAPGAEPVVKVEALLLLLQNDDDLDLEECIGRHGWDDALLGKEEEGSEDVRPKRQRIM